MKKEVVAHKDPKSPISEIFRTLRTNIQFINTNKNIQTLLVTSTLPGEGKSWIASNLAVAFAQTGKKVVLIDADMRKGRQYVIFETPPAPGLSNYLSEIGINKKEDISSDEILDCIQKTEVPNLYLMPAGSIPPNPSELLVSPKMIKVLDKFKQAFDIVIIDGTPCELVTDAVILSRVVDSTIVVTAHKVTKKDALERVIKSIQNVGGNLTGVVVNKMPISGKKYEKTYYYYGESSERSKEVEDNKQSEEVVPAKEEKIEEIKKETKPISIKRGKARTTKTTDSNTKKTTKAKAEKTTDSATKKTTKAKTTKSEEVDTKKETKPKTTKSSKAKEKKAESKEEVTPNKTEDILKQMNKYLEKANKEKEE